MKLSTARKLVCMSYFTQSTKMRDELATATRIVHSADTTRYLFPDGSVIESNKGNWKVVGMEKNPKLEAAVRRFGNGQKLPNAPFIDHEVRQFSKEEICEHFNVPFKETPEMKTRRLELEVAALQQLLNEKDELASRPMVVRLDWWAVALIAVVLVAHYGFGVL